MSCNVFMNNTIFMYSLIEVAFPQGFNNALLEWHTVFGGLDWTGLD